MFIIVIIGKNEKNFYLRKIPYRFFYNAQYYILQII